MPNAQRMIDNFADLSGLVAASQMTPGSPHACYVVASNNAPAKVKATADWVCDGVDDQVQIQAALDAAYAAGEGKVFLSSGTFYVSAPMTWYSGMMLEGCGINTTTLRVIDTADCGIFDFANLASTRLFGMMRNFTASGGSTPYAIDAVVTGAGGSFSLAAAHGDRTAEFQAGRTLRIFGSTNNDGSWLIAGAAFIGGKTVITVDAGLTVLAVADGSATWKTSLNYFIKNTTAGAKYHFDFHLSHVYALRFGGHIVESYQAWGWDISHSILENCWGNALEFDVNLGGSGNSGGLKCLSNKIKDVRGHGVRIDGGSQWTLIGNEFGGNSNKSATAKYAIQIEEAANCVTLVGNRFNMTDVDKSLAGFVKFAYVTTPVYNFTIQGNLFVTGSAPPANFALMDLGYCNYGIYSGNLLLGTVSGNNRHANILPVVISGSSRRVVRGANFGLPIQRQVLATGGDCRFWDDAVTFVSGSVNPAVFNLPAVTEYDLGLRVSFAARSSGRVTVQAPGTDRIYNSSAGGTIYTDDDGGTGASQPFLMLELILVSGGVGLWYPVAKVGTWVTT